MGGGVSVIVASRGAGPPDRVETVSMSVEPPHTHSLDEVLLLARDQGRLAANFEKVYRTNAEFSKR
jgi:hypothetical protein